MYYIKIDNSLKRTIEKSIYSNYSLNKINVFLKLNNINQSRDIEKTISENYYFSYCYAKNILKSRFEQGEPTIATDAFYSYVYARDILRGRFELSDPTIAKDSYSSCWYAIEVLNSRFYLGEPVIKKTEYKKDYEEHFGIKL